MFDATTAQNAKNIYEKICSALDARKWHYQRDDESLDITFGVNGEDIPMEMHISVNAERKIVMLISPLNFRVAEDKRLDLAIAVCAVNSLLAEGNFDYDIASGTLGFRITQSYLESDISVRALDTMISVSCGLTDKFNDKFKAISTGELDVQRFVEDWFAR